MTVDHPLKKLAFLYNRSPGKDSWDLMQGLARDLKDEFELHVFCLMPPSQAVWNSPIGLSDTGIHVHPLCASRWRLPRVLKQVREIVRREGISLLHTCGVKEDIWGYLLKRIEPDLHWVTTLADPLDIYRSRSLKKKIYRRMIQSVPWTVFGSEFDKSLLGDWVDSQKASIIYPGIVESNGSRLNKKPGDIIQIIFVGDLNAGSGCADLIKAYSLIKPTMPDIKLYVYGAGSEKLKLMMWSEKQGLVESVGFFDPPQDLHEVFSQAGIYVQPSCIRGVNVSLLTAMYHRVPIIASWSSSAGECVMDDESALMVRPGDVIQMSMALKKLIGDKVLQQKLTAKARRVYDQKFCYERMVERYRVLYRVVSG